MGRLRPQHSLVVRRQSDRQQYRFLLSGFTDHEKSTLAASITKLGGKYLDSKIFVPDCTHIVSVRPMRSEKYLCGCAAGKWIVTPEYITASVAASQWFDEESYVWGSDQHASANQCTPSMADAPRRWMKHLQQTNQRAFSGWTVAILVSTINNRPAVYRRLIECGGGVVLPFKGAIKDPDDFGKLLNYIFVDKCYEEKVRPLKARGVPCLAPEFIAEYLFEQSPSKEKYEIGNYAAEPKKKRKADTGKVCKAIQTTLTMDTNQRTSRSLKQKTQEINLGFESLEFTSSSQSTLSQSSISSGNNVRRNRSTLPQSPLTSSPLTPAGPRACGQTVCTEADSSTGGSETAVKRKLTFSPSMVHQTVSNVKQKHSGGHYSRIPYWMQVRPPKYGNEPNHATAFPRVISSLIEAHLEEDFWLKAVHSIHAHLTAKKYPPSSLLHVIMSKIVESTDDAFKNHSIHLLKSVLCLHPPSTPEMSQVYLQSFVPSDEDDLFGLESDDPINTPWDFIGSVIRKSLQRPTKDETDTKESQVDCAALRHSSELLLGYIVALLEQDFQAYTYRKENPQPSVRKSRHCMISTVLWPNHRLRVSVSTVRQLISFLLEAVTVTEETPSMYPCLRMVMSLVELAAKYCRIATGNSDMLSDLKTGIHVDLAAEIASMAAQDGLPDNTQSLNILLSLLQPDWLKLRVVESLLNSYDDCLVSEENRHMTGKPLSLKKVVTYYFYLVPPTAKNCSTSETPKGTQEPKINLKRPCQEKTYAPLKTKATSNVISKTKQETSRFSGQQGAKLNNKVNQRNRRGETRLHVACMKNDVAKVHDLLMCPAINVNLCDFAGWTALHEAANHGHVACVKELLKYRPRQKITSYFMPDKSAKCQDFLDLVAAPAECGTTPLHDAVTNGHVEVAKLLVQAGGKAVFTARNKAGLMALDIATDDAMKCALELGGKDSKNMLDENHNKENILTNSRGQKRPSTQQGTPAKRLCTGKNNVSPSEETYSSVLGSTQNPTTFVTAEKCEQYCLLICHLLQACLRTHKLVAIKAGLHEQQESPDTANETADSELMPAVEYVMANASHSSNECDLEVDSKDMQNTSSSGRLLMEDLTEMANLENHLAGFVNHLGRLGPWVGSQRSSVCNKIIHEMRILVETCL